MANEQQQQQRYTVEEAAVKIGFRPDDLFTLLPDVGIDLNVPGHEGGTLSEAEIARLTRLVGFIQQVHQERSV